MPPDPIRDAIARVIDHYERHPERAVVQDRVAVAIVEDGLRCVVTGDGGARVVTDMPAGIGGGGDAPTPGWFLRAALASCDATLITMRAAQMGLTLTRLEVTVGSRSDNRGMLGTADAPGGPLDVDVHVAMAADGASPDELRELIAWVEAHSPVQDAVRRAVPVRLHLQAG